MTEIIIDVEAFLGILVTIIGICTPPGIIIGRAFWQKHKCFKQQEITLIAQATRIESLEKHDKSALKEHNDYHSRLRVIEEDAIEIKLYLKLLLDNAGIKHN